jgi:hypothetical protein
LAEATLSKDGKIFNTSLLDTLTKAFVASPNLAHAADIAADSSSGFASEVKLQTKKLVEVYKSGLAHLAGN